MSGEMGDRRGIARGHSVMVCSVAKTRTQKEPNSFGSSDVEVKPGLCRGDNVSANE